MDQLVAALQDTLDDTDWHMFRHSSDDIRVFMWDLSGNWTVHKPIIRTSPSQMPWVDKTIHIAHIAAYYAGLTTRNMDKYKAASYNM